MQHERDEPQDRWAATQSLILLCFDDDPDVVHLAGNELLARLRLPAVPLVHDDGRRKISATRLADGAGENQKAEQGGHQGESGPR